MGMDLSVECGHCGAKCGKLCSEDCEINGYKIKKLKLALSDLELRIEDINPERNMKSSHQRCNCFKYHSGEYAWR